MNAAAAFFAILVTHLFLVGEHQGHPRVERKSAAHHVRDHGHGGPDGRVVLLHAVGQGRTSSAWPHLRNITY